MIEFKEATKIYSKEVVALENINLTIEDGEFVFFIGPSGAGKTTLIKLLLKEEEPTEGEIWLDDQDISHIGNRRIPNVRRKMGVVFQDFRLLEDRDVFRNISYALEIHGLGKKEINDRVIECLTMVNLLDKRKFFPHQLSGGEQQRVSIARALVNNPSILIADEPTGNLDDKTAWEIMRILEGVNEAGTTVLMATHAKEIVNTMSKRVVQLEKGHIIRDEENGRYEYEVD